MKQPKILAISGVKNSGKTTLLCELIPRLKANGVKVAVIKHDGHDFQPDMPGTDSFRFQQAGAENIAVFSDHRYMMVANQPISAEDLISQYADHDLILIEGMKTSTYKKIEVVRSANNPVPVCDPSHLLAICSDLPHIQGSVPLMRLDAYDEITALIMSYLAEENP